MNHESSSVEVAAGLYTAQVFGETVKRLIVTPVGPFILMVGFGFFSSYLIYWALPKFLFKYGMKAGKLVWRLATEKQAKPHKRICYAPSPNRAPRPPLKYGS